MATSYYSPQQLPYQPYQPPPPGGGGIGYNNTTDPVKAAANQRAYVTEQGDQYQTADQNLANQYALQQSGTQQYLNPIENNLATGGGGYTPAEQSQILLTPQQQQNITTGAGISAGAGTASSVGAAERAAAASGGNPAAMATYRARAAQTQGAQAGDASTQARIAAQQAGSAGAQAVGNAAQTQQGQALGYYGNLQAQQGGQAQSEQGLAQGAYGTEANAGNTATGQQISASQLPTTTDKVIGGIAGAASGALSSFLADGDVGEGMDAVIGENGPEAVVEAASDPVRSNTTFMDNGYYTPAGSDNSSTLTQYSAVPPPLANAAPSAANASSMPPWLQNYLNNAGKQSPTAPAAAAPAWNKTTPWNQLGTAIGGALNPNGKLMQSVLGPGGVAARVTGGPSSPMTPGNQPGMGSASPGYSASGAPVLVGAGNHVPMGLNRPGFGGSPGSDGSSAGDEFSPYTGGMDSAGGAVAPYLGSATEGIGNAAADTGEALGGAADAVGSGVADAVGSGVADAGAGLVGMLANGKISTGFHWSQPRPRAPHVPAGGYTPLNDRPWGGHMADGGMMGPPTSSQQLAWSSPDIKGEIASAQRAMVSNGQNERANRRVDPSDSRGFAQWAHDDMQANAQEVAAKSRSLRAGKTMMADGGTAPKVITEPTRVKLAPGDSVVPLTFRPKAKVRPSALLPSMAPRTRGMFGAGA